METTGTHTADAKRRPALGKGIESLLGPRPPPAPAAEATGKPLEIALDRIERNPHQTRTTFDEAKLAELAQSIAATGVVQPVVVRELAGGRYQLIMGERRWRASQAAGQGDDPGDCAAGFRRAGDGDDHRREPAARGPEPDGAGAGV